MRGCNEEEREIGQRWHPLKGGKNGHELTEDIRPRPYNDQITFGPIYVVLRNKLCSFSSPITVCLQSLSFQLL